MFITVEITIEDIAAIDWARTRLSSCYADSAKFLAAHPDSATGKYNVTNYEAIIGLQKRLVLGLQALESEAKV